jgi:hypothetical protein
MVPDIENNSVSERSSRSEDSPISSTSLLSQRSCSKDATGKECNKRSGTNKDTSLSHVETRQVDVLRNIVIVILVLSAIGIVMAVYFLTKSAQTDQFNTQYEGAASKILSSFETVIGKIGSVYSIGVAATIEGMAKRNMIIENTTVTTWPFVALDSFEQRAASARTLSRALLVSFQPIVSQGDRELWEIYSASDEAKDWM